MSLGLNNQQNGDASHYRYNGTAIDEMIHAHSAKVDKRLEQADSTNFDRMVHEITSLIRLMHHRSGQNEKMSMRQQEDMIKVDAKVLKDSYSRWSYLVVTVVAGSLQIAAGGAAFSQFAGIAANTANTFHTGLSSTGQGLGAVGKIFEGMDQGDRALHQIRLESTKSLHQEHSQTRSHKQNDQLEIKRACDAHASNVHRTAMGMLGVSAA